MKRAKKIVVLLVAAVLLVTTTVAVTVAYMSSLTDVVTNTFTSGNVEIKLDEALVDIYGEKYLVSNAEENDKGIVTPDAIAAKGEDHTETVTTQGEESRVLANDYKLIPGHTYIKDPTVYVKSGSEECYVFAKVELTKEISEALDNFTVDTANWLPLADQYTTDDEKAKVAGIYYYKSTVDAREAEDTYVKLPAVFSSFTILSDADVTEVTDEDSIKITAYAVQADGMTDVADAWTKAPTNWTN